MLSLLKQALGTSVRKFGTIVSEPKWTYEMIRCRLRGIAHLLSEGRLIEAGLYLSSVVMSPDTHPAAFTRYLQQRHGDYLLTRIHENYMLLSPYDMGLSHDLIVWGDREHYAARCFQRELRQLRETVDGEITVLEIGANIGYYALMEAQILGERANILAVEPSRENVGTFEKNIELNNFADRITVTQCALSDTTGTAELEQRAASNIHRIASPESKESTVPVDTYRVDDFLTEQNVSLPVNVIRMDVEGHEEEILAHAEFLLETDDPLLAFIEIHTSRVSNDEIVDILTGAGLELVSGTHEPIYRTLNAELDDLSGLKKCMGRFMEAKAVEVVMKKNY